MGRPAPPERTQIKPVATPALADPLAKVTLGLLTAMKGLARR
ncbi:MAG TPA: hypothetical protein VHJ99_12310 [Candidatus Dormibacteraeota bacterium]|nr:hypothetical protein [Candidatus Dormibacteraeota bacterium]